MAEYIKSIKLTLCEYDIIKQKILAEYGDKIKIPFICKRELGYVPREFTKWTTCIVDGKNRSNMTQVIYLDFYDEAAKSMFTLKYF